MLSKSYNFVLEPNNFSEVQIGELEIDDSIPDNEIFVNGSRIIKFSDFLTAYPAKESIHLRIDFKARIEQLMKREHRVGKINTDYFYMFAKQIQTWVKEPEKSNIKHVYITKRK